MSCVCSALKASELLPDRNLIFSVKHIRAAKVNISYNIKSSDYFINSRKKHIACASTPANVQYQIQGDSEVFVGV
jgi:hypothetical protein